MNQQKPFHFDQQWYDIWMKQSTQFFDTANTYLGSLFANAQSMNPNDHLKQIDEWIAALKNQWQMTMSTVEPIQKQYSEMFSGVCVNAINHMMSAWKQRVQEGHPVTDVRALYELWLDCCQAEYKKALHNQSMQEAYSEMLNSAMKLWQSSIRQ